MKEIVSIIVPIYNVEKYVERCICSLCSQTYEAIEILLIDDGSTDQSGKLCEEYALKDSRIKVFHKENGGISSARNLGIEKAKGEYFCFVDSDDWVEASFCEKLLAACLKEKTKIAICDFVCVAGEEVPKRESKGTEILSQDEALHCLDFRETAKYRDMTVVWNKIYHRSVFEQVRYPVGKIHEDEFVIARFLLQTQRIVWIREGLYCYFQRQDSIIGKEQRENKVHTDILDAFRDRMEFFIEKDRMEFFRIAWRNYMLSIIEMIMRLDKNKEEKADKASNKGTDKNMQGKQALLVRYRLALTEYGKIIPLKYRLKYRVYLLSPWLYVKLFGIRDV